MRVRDVPEDEESSSHYTLTSLSTGSEGILMADRRIVLYIAGVFVCCTGAAALVSRQRVKKSDVMEKSGMSLLVWRGTAVRVRHFAQRTTSGTLISFLRPYFIFQACKVTHGSILTSIISIIVNRSILHYGRGF